MFGVLLSFLTTFSLFKQTVHLKPYIVTWLEWIMLLFWSYFPNKIDIKYRKSIYQLRSS